MSTQRRRKCRSCSTWFMPDRRNAHHQRFCTQSACRTASKKASQKKWSRKNPSYFRGEHQVRRVQIWRAAHPGYWRRKGSHKAMRAEDALQDLLITQGFDNKEVKVFRNCLSQEIARPLQDLLTVQGHAIVGLTAMITGYPLQDNIGEVLVRCYDRGRRIGGVVPWMPRKEDKHASQDSNLSAAVTTDSAALQLGRPPSGSG